MKFEIRKADSGHRQATWLELFFDLAFVISIATLSHQVVAHPSLASVLRYIALLVPVWWIWNQFTWYASHFDNDDFWFRIFMLAGVAGTLCLAAALHPLLHEKTSPFIFAYLGLHAVLALGWFRAYRHILPFRPYIQFKLVGIALGILIWSLSFLFSGSEQYLCWALGVVIQLLMPIIAWAKVKNYISVHHHHLTERHGLFTIIILGESLVALTHTLGHLHSFGATGESLCLFLVPVALWWIYFDWKYDPIDLQYVSQAFGFNYGHFLLYGSLGVVSAGIGVFPQEKVFGLRLLLLGSAGFLAAMSLMNAIKPHKGFSKRVVVRTIAALALMVLYSLAESISTALLLGILSLTLILVAALEKRIEKNRP